MKNIFTFIFSALIVLLVVGAVYIYKSNTTKPVACTAEAKICPDGTSVGRVGPDCEFSPCPEITDETPTNDPSLISEEEAKAIAEAQCIKGGESLSDGMYNSFTKTWWFDANLNATKEGCHPACVVWEETKTTEINWRCTGLIAPKNIKNEITDAFIEKYPKYENSLTIKIDQETDTHARGSVSFGIGESGGIFLATSINGPWQIVHDGNGQIPCALSSYDFPEEMLTDCSN